MHWEDCNGWYWDMIGPCPGNTLHQTPSTSQRNKRNQWRRYDNSNQPITLYFIRTPPTVTEEIHFPQTGVEVLSLETGIIIFESFYLSAVMAALCLWLITVTHWGDPCLSSSCLTWWETPRCSDDPEPGCRSEGLASPNKGFFKNFLLHSNFLLKFEIGCKTEKLFQFYPKHRKYYF